MLSVGVGVRKESPGMFTVEETAGKEGAGDRWQRE